MNIAASSDPRIVSFQIDEDSMTARLADGRTISVPIVWSWRLAEATPEQRTKFEITGSCEGIHWPEIDEDISARGMLQGTPAPRPSAKTGRMAI